MPGETKMFKNIYNALKSIKRIEKEFDKLVVNYNSGKKANAFKGYPSSNYIIPQTEVLETESRIKIRVMIPNQTLKSIKISIDPEFIEIRSQKTSKEPFKHYYAFVSLPHKIYMKSMEKKYKNDVLFIEFEKYKSKKDFINELDTF